MRTAYGIAYFGDVKFWSPTDLEVICCSIIDPRQSVANQRTASFEHPLSTPFFKIASA
jgi:hypothetical protein